MGSIFGGSKSKSTTNASSFNQAYGDIKSATSPALGNIATGTNAFNAMLSGDATGFNNFKKMLGFDAMAEQGSRGITGNAAASGLLRSGSTAKALQAFGDQMQQQYAGDYMDRLLAQAGLGLQAGQLLAGAGQRSDSTTKSESKGKNGIGGFLGSLASGIAASDRRLKTDIVQVGELENGLNLYRYNYINGSGPYIGVMADEVEKIVPEALGPTIDGYQTVDYSRLGVAA